MCNDFHPRHAALIHCLESVAEFTERPLISLTCSHIGVDPEKVEGKLRLWMVKARRWGAILLIDEADVYLEERTAHDFDRNSLVASVFCRILRWGLLC
jgi:hypothetical protein